MIVNKTNDKKYIGQTVKYHISESFGILENGYLNRYKRHLSNYKSINTKNKK